MKIQIITLFPEMFVGVFDHSMLLKAQKINKLDVSLINLRDFGIGPRKQVDDIPYGGGDGMVLKPEPLFASVDYAKQIDPDAKIVLLTPRGNQLNQPMIRKLSTEIGLVIICGRYEGYDERITEVVDYQLSIGNYILTGGEIPAMVLVDAITRLLPGVLGGETSAQIESFTLSDEVEYPQYTRPPKFRDMEVPKVLLSGHHQDIIAWRQNQSEQRSKKLKADQNN